MARGACRLELFGVPVDRLTAAQALDRARSLLASPPAGGPALVLTPNPELIMQARRGGDLLAAARAADLALADGVGVVWAARRAGLPCPERVPGVEFMERLLADAALTGRSVYLLGARPPVVAAAAANAERRHPGLRVVGAVDGFFPADAEGAAAARVAASGAEILLVGMGTPRQELFLHRQRHRLGAVRLAMAVGGSFDVLAGAVRRAPAPVRRLGLEWLWRLASEPSRWRRQLALPRFAWAVLQAGPGRSRWSTTGR